MAYNAKIFGHFQEMVDYMNGVVVGKKLIKKVYGLNGLTLIINNGVDRTVVFADATGGGLSAKDIYTQIYAVATNLAVLRDYGGSPTSPALAVVRDTNIVKGSGTANAILGFAAVDAPVTALVQANIVTVFRNEGNRYHLIHT